MKKLGMIAMVLMVSTGAFAQGEAVNKFFDKYASDETFTQVTVSSKMFNLFTNLEADTPEDKEVLEAISKLKGLRILAKEDDSRSREYYKEAFAMLPKGTYEELMSVREKEKDMKFMIRESGGKISELLMLMGGEKEFMMLSLFGEIDLKQISRIGKKMNVDGLENLEKMNGDK